MAHYAFIDSNNVVVQVIAGVDETVTQVDSDGTIVGGSTEAWEQFYQSRPWNAGLRCKRTSYNNNFRGVYAGVGFTYDPTNDRFIPPQPFPSWVLDENFKWQAPSPYPSDTDGIFVWDESSLSWVR